jgi:beta-lactam-binding protein with PASTA domain
MANCRLHKRFEIIVPIVAVLLLASCFFLMLLPQVCVAEMIIVPDVKGYSGSQATSILEEKGFKVYSAYLPALGISATQAAQLAARTQITFQKPEAGTQAERNTVITIGVTPDKLPPAKTVPSKLAPATPAVAQPSSNDPSAVYQQKLKE